MGASIPKQFMEVNGKPIILYTLEIFNNHPEIDGIVIACCKLWMKHLQMMVNKAYLEKVVKITEGAMRGSSRSTTGCVRPERGARNRGATRVRPSCWCMTA